MGSLNGSTFEDICNLNCSEGYPLIEVEVVSPTENSAKFIICRENLYLIAFTIENSWVQYNCQFEIEGFTVLCYDGSYTYEPWKQVGPQVIIHVIDCLNTEAEDLEHVQACEIIQVFLCEAARLYPIESIVCKSFSPTSGGNDVHFKRPYQDEELRLPSCNISDEADVFSLVREEGHVDYELALEAPSYVVNLVKNFSKLSRIWFIYALTGKNIFDETEDLSKFHLKSKKSLRCTLAVLCNTNLEKLLGTWKKKKLLSAEVLGEMVRKVKKLQAEKKVLVPKNQGE